jgi:hypothetical protein
METSIVTGDAGLVRRLLNDVVGRLKSNSAASLSG